MKELSERALQKNSANGSLTLSAGLFALYLCILCGQVYYCFTRPIVSLDSLVYASLIDDGSQTAFIESIRACEAQRVGRANICQFDVEMYRGVVRYTPADFKTFTRFYTVKPLYIAIGKVLHKVIGLPTFVALKATSAFSLAGIGVTLFAWLLKHLEMYTSCILSSIILSLPQVTQLGKNLMPDGLSLALTLLVIYVITYGRGRLYSQILLLAILPLVRPDNIIFCIFVGMALIYRSSHGVRPLFVRATMLLSAGVIFQSLVAYATHALSYRVLFVHSFLDFSHPSLYAESQVKPADVLHVFLGSGIVTLALFFPLPLLFSVYSIWNSRTWRPLRDIAIASMASAFVHFMLYPADEQRYYTNWLVTVTIIATVSFGRESFPGRKPRVTHEELAYAGAPS